MKIVFIQTGGTIDKDYPRTTNGRGFEFGEPAISRVLEKLNPTFEYHIVIPIQKDSLEITNSDRENLANLIKSNDGEKFIITHGTDTMIETAHYLGKRIKNKLLVITGAMKPERFTNSDAPINIGCAIATANLMEKGIFITMHGIVKSYLEIERNLETGKYY